jgi:hypothetical protein
MGSWRDGSQIRGDWPLSRRASSIRTRAGWCRRHRPSQLKAGADRWVAAKRTELGSGTAVDDKAGNKPLPGGYRRYGSWRRDVWDPACEASGVSARGP